MIGRRTATTLLSTIALVLFLGVGSAIAAYSSVPRTGTWVPNAPVYAIAVHGDRVYIGGAFTSVRNPATGATVARGRLAAFDATTGALVESFNPSADRTVRALAVSEDGSMVYAGGEFLQVNGSASTRVAAVDRNGDLVPGWNASATSPVRDLVVQGGSLYVGGQFSRMSGLVRTGLARLSASSGAVSSWTSNAREGRVLALGLSPDGTRLLVGGSFNVIDGVRQSFLASVLVANGDATSWQPPPRCSSCPVLDLTAHGDDVYTAVAGPGGRIMSYDADLDLVNWDRGADGDVQAVAYHEGVVYAGGHFGPTFRGAQRHQLAAVFAADGALHGFAPAFTGADYPGVWALDAGTDFLRVGGGFRGVESGPQARYAEFPYF